MPDKPVERLKLIQGGDQPKPYRRRKPRQLEQVVCPRCNGSAAIKVKLCPMSDGRRVTGGTDQHVCAFCLAKGHVEILY